MLFTDKTDTKSITKGKDIPIRFPTDEELLNRSSIDVTDAKTREFYKGKTVLVTGGGGSIGSELSRKIAECSPKRLIIFDINENNAFDIQQELAAIYGDELDLVIEIGSVQDMARLECVFEKHCPEIVFHAAAHKHVPFMEHSFGYQSPVATAANAGFAGGSVHTALTGTQFAVYIIHNHPVLWAYHTMHSFFSQVFGPEWRFSI